MEYDLHMHVKLDARREVECWYFSPKPICEADMQELYEAHHEVLDMFLAPQPIIAVKQNIGNVRGAGRVSPNAQIIAPEYLNPPYNLILVNTHALELLEGRTITEKFGKLIDFYIDKEQRHFLIDLLKDMQLKRLYIVAKC